MSITAAKRLLLTCLLACSCNVLAAAIDVELSPFSKATHLVSVGRYQQASEHWHQTTISILGSEARLGRNRMWQYAGLSEALAAMAADKENDAIAYQYWADSTRFLMMGGTNWEQMRKRLHQRYERANTQLSTQLQITDVVSSIDEEWQKELSILQIWEEKLALFSYTSPQLGLHEKQSYVADPVITTPVPKTYYQPSSGNKKLSGMKTQFRKDSQFVPITSAEDESSLPERPQQEQAVKSDSGRLVIPRPLKTGAGNQHTEIAPLMNKTIRISGPLEENEPERIKPVKLESEGMENRITFGSEVGEQPTTDDDVVIFAVEPYQFTEQLGGEQSSATEANVNMKKNEAVVDSKAAVFINPVARGNELSANDKGVEAVQRRSLSFDTAPSNSSEQ